MAKMANVQITVKRPGVLEAGVARHLELLRAFMAGGFSALPRDYQRIAGVAAGGNDNFSVGLWLADSVTRLQQRVCVNNYYLSVGLRPGQGVDAGGRVDLAANQACPRESSHNLILQLQSQLTAMQGFGSYGYGGFGSCGCAGW